MAMQKLSQASAFGSGSDLWILPPLENSSWTRKIDWYLNFQISRAKGHHSLTLSPELKEILTENDLPFFELKKDPKRPSPLLIASHSYLPNKMTLELPWSNELQTWVQDCHRHWDCLGRPPLRVFLPLNVNSESFLENWLEPQTSVDITLVNEVETRER